MNKSKRLLIVITVLFLALALSAPVYANQPVQPTEGIKSGDPLKGSSRNFRDSSALSIESIYLIESWGCEIQNLGGGMVNINGFTDAYNLVDYLTVRIYLQVWDGTSWVDTGYYASYSNSNNNYVAAGNTFSVATGKYYRARASHYAENGSLTDSTSSVSSYIYVN